MSLSSSSLPAETGGADGDRLAALAGCSHECPASPRARCQLKAHELSAFSRTGLQVQQAMLGGDLASKGHIGLGQTGCDVPDSGALCSICGRKTCCQALTQLREEQGGHD